MPAAERAFDHALVSLKSLPSAWLRTPSGTAATSHSHGQTTRVAKDERTPEGDRNVKQVGTGTRKFPCCSRPLRMSGVRPQSLQDPQRILRVVDSCLRAQVVKISFYRCSKREDSGSGVMCHGSDRSGVSPTGSLSAQDDDGIHRLAHR
jgi:hypothetical protein